jgi:hypothetical protein
MIVVSQMICKNAICYSGSSEGIRFYNTCLFSISPEPISNTRMFIYFVYCIPIISKDPGVFGVRVRLLVKVEFAIYSLSFELMFMNDNI